MLTACRKWMEESGIEALGAPSPCWLMPFWGWEAPLLLLQSAQELPLPLLHKVLSFSFPEMGTVVKRVGTW